MREDPEYTLPTNPHLLWNLRSKVGRRTWPSRVEKKGVLLRWRDWGEEPELAGLQGDITHILSLLSHTQHWSPALLTENSLEDSSDLPKIR